MLLIALLTAADIPIGRFDKRAIPQQSLMEMLVQDFYDVAITKDTAGDPISIREWYILAFDECWNITGIDINIQELFIETETERRSITKSPFSQGGSIDFAYLPLTLKILKIIEMEFEGSIDTQRLPEGLEVFSIPSNCIQGTFDVSGLPRDLRHVDISNNTLSGSLAMEFLPEKMEHFMAQLNAFDGEVRLDSLPLLLSHLDLANNALSGRLELRNVPRALIMIKLFHNAFRTDKAIVDASNLNVLIRLDMALKGNVYRADGGVCELEWMDFVH